MYTFSKTSVDAFSEKVRQSCAAKQIQFNILHEQADVLIDELDEEKRIREEFELEMANNFYPIPNTDEPLTLEQIGYLAVEREQNARKDIQNKIANVVDEKVFGLSLALAKEKKLREEEEDQCFNEFHEELQKICDEIEYEKQIADSNTDKMIQKLSQEIGGFHEALHEEIEKRENGQESLLKMIEDTHAVLMNDIQLKRREREETEESLLKLLEDTCHKMEDNIYS